MVAIQAVEGLSQAEAEQAFKERRHLGMMEGSEGEHGTYSKSLFGSVLHVVGHCCQKCNVIISRTPA